jgi:hypothetical protein
MRGAARRSSRGLRAFSAEKPAVARAAIMTAVSVEVRMELSSLAAASFEG